MNKFFKHSSPPQDDSHKNEVQSDIKVNITIDGIDSSSYASGMGVQPHNDNLGIKVRKHVKKLLAFYEEQSKIYTYGPDATSKLIKEVNPNANQNTCPYCGVVHPFTATRARKCPDCGEKMVVRNGVFIREAEAEKLQTLATAYYEKAQELDRLKKSIQRAEDDRLRRVYGDSFLAIAEAYESCGIVYNQSYEGGFSAWDYAWGVLNREALEATTVIGKSLKDSLTHGYAELLYARGMHWMRYMKYVVKANAQNKYAYAAISSFYSYLIELRIYNVTHWQANDAIRLIHVAIKYGDITDNQLTDIETRISSRIREEAAKEMMKKVVSEVKEYILVENDPERLKFMIY